MIPSIIRSLAPIGLAAGLIAHGATPATLEFQLLPWTDTDATTALPSAVGHKPSAPMPTPGDWLVFTGDDVVLPGDNNPAGALSHNFVDITGAGGPGFNLAPSLSGSLILQLESAGGSNWTVTVSALAYAGQANALQTMNQFLVTPSSPAVTNSAFNVEGLGNTGQWRATPTDNWAIDYDLDFYFATSADGDPSPEDIDATFNDKSQSGFLIPVSQLTAGVLGTVSLDDPLGFHLGDFHQYLLDEIVPRLPPEATYLLVTQMGKTQPDYAEAGLPITTNALIGNTTFAFTTQTLADTPELLSLSLHVTDGQPVLRFNGSAEQAYEILRSADLRVWEPLDQPMLTYPEAGVVEWTDPSAAADQAFYRVRSLTP